MCWAGPGSGQGDWSGEDIVGREESLSRTGMTSRLSDTGNFEQSPESSEGELSGCVKGQCSSQKGQHTQPVEGSGNSRRSGG